MRLQRGHRSIGPFPINSYALTRRRTRPLVNPMTKLILGSLFPHTSQQVLRNRLCGSAYLPLPAACQRPRVNPGQYREQIIGSSNDGYR